MAMKHDPNNLQELFSEARNVQNNTASKALIGLDSRLRENLKELNNVNSFYESFRYPKLLRVSILTLSILGIPASYYLTLTPDPFLYPTNIIENWLLFSL